VRLVVDAVAEALLRPGTAPRKEDPIDWARLGLKPPVT